MGIRISDWAKTVDGIEILEQQCPFVLGGQVWQGWGGRGAISADESQMTDEEIRDCMDIDGTKQKVWQARRTRLEGRLHRKMEEYDKRRHELRKQRTEIVAAMQQQQSMGLSASPDDAYQVQRIDQRLARLRDMSQEQEHAAAALESGEALAKQEAQPIEDEAAVDARAVCDICGDRQAALSATSAYRWLQAHKMGKHRSVYQKQKALERQKRKEAAAVTA